MSILYVALLALVITLVINLVYYIFNKKSLVRHYNIGLMVVLFIIIIYIK